MNNKLLSFSLLLCLMTAGAAHPDTLFAQKKLLLKGGPAFVTGTDNLVGFGAGLEVQLGQRTSLSATYNYLKGYNLPSDQELVSSALSIYGGRDYLVSTSSLLVDFRCYPHKNIFYPLEGFFIGFGAELGNARSKWASEIGHYDDTGNYVYSIDIQEEKYPILLPNVSLGFVKSINEKLSFEVSAGLKVDIFDDQDDRKVWIPFGAGLRYTLY